MHRPGYTVTPDYQPSEPGLEPELQGFNVNPGRLTAAPPEHVFDDWTPDEQGRYHYAYEDGPPGDQQDYEDLDWYEMTGDGGFDAGEYYGALAELPNVRESLEWAESHFSSEFIEAYHEALDNDDLETVNTMLEQIVAAYEELGAAEDAESSMEDDADNISEEWTEEDVETYNETVEMLTSQAPDAGVAAQWDQAGMQALHHGDDTAAAIYAATSAYHSGELEAGDAIDAIIDNYPIEEIRRVVSHLMQR